MSGLFGRKSSSTTIQAYTGISVSTSMYGNAIPLMYGTNRATLNLMWYGNFTATPNKSNNGGKGGGSTGVSSYNYSASWIGALVEGPIHGIGTVWHDKAIETLTSEDLSLSLGGSAPAIWSYLTSNFPGQAIPYDHIAYVATANYNLGDSASMPNLSFEVQALLYNTGPSGQGDGGTFTGNCTVSGTTISGVTVPSNLAVGSVLSDTNGALQSGTVVTAFSSGGGTVTISPAALLTTSKDTITYSVNGATGDADPSQIIVDYLTDPNHGAGYQGTIASLSGNNNYQGYVWSLGMGLSPYESTQRQANDFLTEILQITNSDVVDSAGTLKIIPYADAPVSGNGYSYTPNLTPLYVFTDDHFLYEDGAAPVKLTRKPLSETYNYVNIEFVDRSNQYNTAIAAAFDLNDINTNGVRQMSTLTFHEITTYTVARLAAQLILQTSLYERNTYTFKVRADFCLVEPMDYVSLYDAGLGIAGQLVRITQVTDSGEDELEIEAMEVPGTIRTAPVYNWNSAAGYKANYAAPPESVQTPSIFVAPPYLASQTSAFEVWAAVAPQSDDGAWGGCHVYVSVDGGTTYYLGGAVTNPARYGTLTANLPNVADPDTSSTLSVAIADTNLVFDPVTDADADNLQTLMLIAPNSASCEILAYGSETLSSPGNYNLSYLRRGFYGTEPAAFTSGTAWVRLDGSIFKLVCDPGLIGTTIYLKFASYNTWGREEQDLSTVTAYGFGVLSTIPAGGAISNIDLIPRGTCSVNGTTVQKTTGAAAWDSDAYSGISYTGGCSCSFRWEGGTYVMGGLVSNPSGNTAGTYSSGYLWYMTATNISIYENNTGTVIVASPPSPGDQFSIVYDGYYLYFYYNAVLKYTSKPAPGLTLSFDAPMYSAGSILSDVTFTPHNSATPTQWNTIGNCVVNDENVVKQGGSAAWDSSAYSLDGYETAHILAKANIVPAGNNMFVFGFTTTPSASANYTNIKYGWYANNTGDWCIYESGTAIGSYSAVALTDSAVITYNGSTITYLLNGTVIRTVSVASLVVFGQVSVYGPGAGVNSLEFGSSATVPLTDTTQLGLNAATEIHIATASNYTLTPSSTGAIASLSIGPFAYDAALVCTGVGSETVSLGVNADYFFTTLNVIVNEGSGSPMLSNAANWNTGLLVPASSNVASDFAMEITYDLPAGSTATVGIYGEGACNHPTTTAILVAACTLKVEVIKR